MPAELKTAGVLDVGCSRNKVSGAIGIDIDPKSQADIIHDLNQCRIIAEDFAPASRC